jgi:hypothetical protein
MDVKRPRIEPNGKYKEISSNRSKFTRFNTSQYVTRFVVQDLGDDPEYELGQLLEQLIDKAYDNAKKEYGREPTKYNILIDGPSLSVPVTVTMGERVKDVEIEIVNY